MFNKAQTTEERLESIRKRLAAKKEAAREAGIELGFFQEGKSQEVPPKVKSDRKYIMQALHGFGGLSVIKGGLEDCNPDEEKSPRDTPRNTTDNGIKIAA